MNIEEKIKVMTAYQQGKQIEFRLNCATGQSGWSMTAAPTWDWEHYEYRENNERMTNKQLAKWLAGNNGQKRKSLHSIDGQIYTYHTYLDFTEDEPVNENIVIRPWNSNKWVTPLKSMLDINVDEEII